MSYYHVVINRFAMDTSNKAFSDEVQIPLFTLKDTFKLGHSFANILEPGDILFLDGQLGSGKPL